MKKLWKAFLALAVTFAVLASCIVGTSAVSKAEWEDAKAIADMIQNLFYESGQSLSYSIAVAAAEKYGYEIAEDFEYEAVSSYIDEETGVLKHEYFDEYLEKACSELLTKDQILTVLKELYPGMSDDLADYLWTAGEKNAWTDQAWFYPASNGNYAVGVSAFGGFDDYRYAGYTEGDDDTLSFYYALPGNGDGPNVASIDYNGKTYFALGYNYITGEGDDAVAVNAVTYNGKKYVCAQDADGYFASSMPEYGTEKYENLFDGMSVYSFEAYYDETFQYWQDAASLTVDGVVYYHHDGGFYPLNLPESQSEAAAWISTIFTEDNKLKLENIYPALDNEHYSAYTLVNGVYYRNDGAIDYNSPLTVPVLYASTNGLSFFNDGCRDTFFYYDGSYYRLPATAWGEQLTSIDTAYASYYYSEIIGWFFNLQPTLDYEDILDLDVVEADNGKTYRLEYSSYFEAEDGTPLSEAMWDAEEKDFLVIDGVTYYENWQHFQSLPDYGVEIVLKVSDGKVNIVSYDEVDAFPENLFTDYTKRVVAYSIVEDKTDTTWTKNNEAGLVITSDADFGKFVSVKVDGTVVSPENYTAESGSTKVTFKPSYLATLSDGEHVFTIVSTDGEASATLTLLASTSRNTADAGTALWGASVLAAASALTLACTANKKRKETK